MKNKPINLKTHDVQALLAGRKTQHRVVVKNVSGQNHIDKMPSKNNPGRTTHVLDAIKFDLCPFGKPGQMLWVRESFFANDGHWTDRVDYKASFTDDVLVRWSPSVHMPRHLSRLTLKITNIRVERLQDISDEDAIGEGCRSFFDKDNHEYLYCPNGSKIEAYPLKGAKEHYQRLWISTHGKGSWEANPFVWALSFEVINKNVDEVLNA